MNADINQFQAVIFDFDGTLVPCLDLREMKRRVLEFTVTSSNIARDEIESMLMVELITHTAQWMSANNRNGQRYFREAHQLIKNIEIDAAANTSLYAGVIPLLDRLQNNNLKIGIVTRNCSDAVEIMFPTVHDYCSAVYTRDDVDYLKPDPRHLLICLEKLRCEPEHALMVGDGVLDMTVAKAVHMKCVAVLGGHNSRAELRDADPDWLIPNVVDLFRPLSDLAP